MSFLASAPSWKGRKGALSACTVGGGSGRAVSDEYYLEEPEELKALKAAYRTYLGGVWERLVRETLARKRLPGFAARFRKAARWWGTGTNQEAMEVDVVAESVDGKTLLVGEAKLKLTRLEAEHEFAELQKKALLLPFVQNYEKVICRLFVAENPAPGEIGMDWIMA